MGRGLLGIGAAVLSLSLAVGGGALAQEADNVTAAVHAGTCDEPGDRVAQLDALNPHTGQTVGAEGIPTVLRSDTDDIAGIGGSRLYDQPHLIAVFSGETMVACGEIGGPLDDDELTIGLSPVDDSGYFGIAKLDDLDDDDDAEVELYVVQPVS